MMRSLWTAASGMRAQQTNVDTISNNLANVNTIGYKKETAEFKSLLYQTIQAKTTSANGDTKPIGAQVGLGVKNSSITSIYKQGNITQTEKSTDFAIQGDGFFTLRDINGDTVYTRNGQFMWTTSPNGVMLANSDGLAVLDINGEAIEFDPEEIDVSEIMIDSHGELFYPDEENNPQSMDIQMALVQFANPSGLEKQGNSIYALTDASGEPKFEVDGVTKPSMIKQGYIEGSNVQVVDEMVNLIVAQRAYEMNSKAITTTDEMMKQANQLKS